MQPRRPRFFLVAVDDGEVRVLMYGSEEQMRRYHAKFLASPAFPKTALAVWTSLRIEQARRTGRRVRIP